MPEVCEFALPDLGEGLTEATVVRWLVAVGEVVAVDQAVVEVETAKAMVEVPCPYAGVVTAQYAEEGAELPVGSPLITVASGAESGPPGVGSANASDVPGGPSGGPQSGSAAGAARADVPGPTAAEAPEAEHVGGSGNVLVGYGTRSDSGGRRRSRRGRAGVAERGGEPAGASSADSAGGRTVPVISPLVRRLARESGVDLRRVAGSGPDGLIVRADVERAALTAESAPAADPVSAAGGPESAAGARPARERSGSAIPASSGSGATWSDGVAPSEGSSPSDPGESRIPLTGLRGVAAAKFSRSRQEIPDASCWVEADATELLAARQAMNAAPGQRISLLALLARICTDALAGHPELNATVDTSAGEIVRLPRVHLGFAAQTERGLMVPVVRNADALDTGGLSAELARLTEAAHTGALAPGELTGGTFTLNNYGVFGVDGSTPILNYPEAAMLGVGRIVEKPWAHRGELVLRRVVQLSLTFDHRVCDGGTAGGFLRYVANRVEQPALLLRTL